TAEAHREEGERLDEDSPTREAALFRRAPPVRTGRADPGPGKAGEEQHRAGQKGDQAGQPDRLDLNPCEHRSLPPFSRKTSMITAGRAASASLQPVAHGGLVDDQLRRGWIAFELLPQRAD